MKFIQVFCFCLWQLTSFSQEIVIEGKIINSEDSIPIAFATIGIENKNFGTVANEEGYFKYRFNANAELGATDSFVVGCVGYYPQKIGLNDFNKGFYTVQLVPNVTLMNEVIVKPSSSCKNVELGKANHTGLGYFDYYSAKEKHFDDKLGREQGVIINLNSQKIYSIKQLNAYIATTQFKKVLFRVCFYKVSEGKIISENILTQDIHWEIQGNNIGWNTLDLSSYNIILHDVDEIAVTLQWIKSEPINEKSKFFSIKASNSVNKNHIFRDKSNSDWKTNNGNMSIFITAKSCNK